MAITSGTNYKPLRIDFRRGQDALYELATQHRKILPSPDVQRDWIREALSRAFDTYASHPDFSMSKFERGIAMEDTLYDTLESRLLRR